jgi:hypothetical protein
MDIFKYLSDEDGAVTVDWVVLTAAIVGLGVAVLASVGGSTMGVTEKISQGITGQIVATY